MGMAGYASSWSANFLGAKRSKLEEDLLFQLQHENLPEPECEYKFLEDRKFRFDLAWPMLMVAAEVEGGSWILSGHTSGTGINRDCEKGNLAQLNGWIYLRFTSNMIQSGEAIETLREALK